MGVAETVEQQLQQTREAVSQALIQARAFAIDEIVQPLQAAVTKLDAINSRADGAMDRFIHSVEQSRYTAYVVCGAMLFTLGAGVALGWAGRAAFG